MTEVTRPRWRFALRQELKIRPAARLSGLLLLVAVLIAFVTKSGDGFAPRVETLDALAGLLVGAFVVDRLLTFIPAWSAGENAETRTLDIDTLRWGWGALLGAGFVAITGLGAVAALTGTDTPINARVDRVIAVLAIAGGVKGLNRVKDAVNPPKKTSKQEEEVAAAGTDPPPSFVAYVVGFVALGVGCLIAALAHGDTHGLELLGSGKQSDGSMAVVTRFGPVLVAAAVVQQIVERSLASSITGPDKKLLTGSAAVVLGVIATRVMDLYLLHNVGFFGASGGVGQLNTALAASTSTERFADVMLTGLVIAAGTTPLHDLAEGLKRARTTA
jgi:hypothetical protein